MPGGRGSARSRRQWMGLLDLDAVEAAFTQVPPSISSANPHNPTGLVMTRRSSARSPSSPSASGPGAADEIHAPLTLEGARTSLPLPPRAQARGIALVSASKAWNLPGLSVRS